MKRFWRRWFFLPDENPEQPRIKSYKLMVARQADADVAAAQPIGCMICPCVDRKWFIVTVCPCAGYLCDTFPYEFIGTMIPAGETPPYFVQASYAGRSTSFQVFDIPYEAPIDWSTTGGHVGNQEFRVDVAPLNSIIWAVRHTTAPAPFASTVESRVIIDGEYAGDWNGEAATNEEVDIGDSVVPGISAQVDCILVDHAFTESGFHTVDLKVVFTGKNGEGTTGYTVRHIIRVGPKSGTLNWLNQVGIVPEEYVFDDCGSPCLRVSDEEVSRVAAYTSVLKGPFDSRADALEVLTTWNGLITAYAATCVCEPGCGWAILIADAIEEYHGRHVLTHLAAGDNAEYRCEDGWARYDVSSANDIFQGEFPDMLITPWLYDERDGSWTQAGVKGVIEPCQVLFFVVTGEGVSAGGLGTDIGLGTVEPLTLPSPCCLDDPASAYYEAVWVYDTNTDEGVPNNSAELADYKASFAI
jgi:hypothetical protein